MSMNPDSIPELYEPPLTEDENEGKHSSEIMSPQMKNLIESATKFNRELAQSRLIKNPGSESKNSETKNKEK